MRPLRTLFYAAARKPERTFSIIMSAKLHLFLIRHGESFNNALGGTTTSYDDYFARRATDPDLTEKGRQQAELLARHLAESDGPEGAIQRIYVSAMRRALLTAQPIAAALNAPVEVHLDIFEHGGLFSGNPRGEGTVGQPGLTRAEFAMHFPAYMLNDAVTEYGWYQGGHESLEECDMRALRVADQLALWAEDADEVTIALVSHATFIDRLLKALLGASGANSFHFSSQNTGMTRVDFLEENRRALRYTNRTIHLQPELITH